MLRKRKTFRVESRENVCNKTAKVMERREALSQVNEPSAIIQPERNGRAARKELTPSRLTNLIEGTNEK